MARGSEAESFSSGSGNNVNAGGCVLPDYLPQKGWSLNSSGYLIYTSRRKDAPLKRGTRAHRAIMEKILGRKLEAWERIHHQNFNKVCTCPHNFILMPACFNPSNSRRDPYTGEFMSAAEWERRYR